MSAGLNPRLSKRNRNINQFLTGQRPTGAGGGLDIVATGDI